jgi:hypothetical protein
VRRQRKQHHDYDSLSFSQLRKEKARWMPRLSFLHDLAGVAALSAASLVLLAGVLIAVT